MNQDFDPLPEAAIRAALARVLASQPFRTAPQLAAFLSFVVEKALSGEASAIKGYTIATQALGRPDDFDPQADPIVRVEAGRLRKVLAAYYTGPGAADPLRIVIPRGTYVPAFEQVPAGSDGCDFPKPEASVAAGPGAAGRLRPARPATMVAAAIAVALSGALAALLLGQRLIGSWTPSDGRPLIVVTQVEVVGPPPAGFAPAAMRGLIVEGLARFDEVAVADLATGHGRRGTDRYVLYLRVNTAPDGAVHLSARLGHEPSGQVVWVRRFDPAQRVEPEEPSAESDVARQIATALGHRYGVVFTDLRTRPGTDDRVRCVFAAYDHWHNPSRASHARALACFEEVVAAQPHGAIGCAYLAFLYLEEHRLGRDARPAPLERAMQAARRAIEIAPESARANQALMGVLFARGDIEDALARGKRAHDLNPFDADILADFGSKLVQAGRYRQGAALVTRAAAANPVDPPWYDFSLFLAAFMQDDWPAAGPAAGRIEAPDYVPGLLAKIAVAGRAGESAADLIARLVQIQPEYATDPQGALAKRNFYPAIHNRLLEALRNAGLRV